MNNENPGGGNSNIWGSFGSTPSSTPQQTPLFGSTSFTLTPSSQPFNFGSSQPMSGGLFSGSMFGNTPSASPGSSPGYFNFGNTGSSFGTGQQTGFGFSAPASSVPPATQPSTGIGFSSGQTEPFFNQSAKNIFGNNQSLGSSFGVPSQQSTAKTSTPPSNLFGFGTQNSGFALPAQSTPPLFSAGVSSTPMFSAEASSTPMFAQTSQSKSLFDQQTPVLFNQASQPAASSQPALGGFNSQSRGFMVSSAEISSPLPSFSSARAPFTQTNIGTISSSGFGVFKSDLFTTNNPVSAAPSVPPQSAATAKFQTSAPSSFNLGSGNTTVSQSTTTAPATSNAGIFSSSQPILSPPSGISPSVSGPPTSQPTSQPAVQTSAPPSNLFSAPISEISPSVPPKPQTSQPQTTSLSSGSQPKSTAPATTTAPAAVTQTTTGINQTNQTLLGEPKSGLTMGAVIQKTLPVAKQMEENFHYISKQLDERDVVIMRRSKKLKELQEEYERVVARRVYFDREMERLEAQLEGTQKHVEALMESFERYVARQINGDIPLRSAFDLMYDELMDVDSTFGRMEEVLESVVHERTTSVSTRSDVPSIHDIEAIFVKLADLDKRRRRILRVLKQI